MDGRLVKYNPAFLSREELVERFVVHHAELDLIVQAIRENTGRSNQHVLVIGPRGIGKTMLVLRAAEEVRRQKDLADRWYPLVFAEESYQVTTPGEFWLEAVFHLAQTTQDPQWKMAHEELQRESKETRLRERALAQLLDFADAQQKRLLLVVENLNMLLGEQMTDDDGWVLRHPLLHEPRIMLLTTATSRFEQIENAGQSMFELFRVIDLEPLNQSDCRKMWTSINGEEPSDHRIRPIQILTGGNPRLVAVISSFGARMSFQKLMTDLMRLVDDHTEYFKSHLDSLAPTERKVYLALVELWDPVGARAVAEAARLDVNKTSALLRRLVERGAVVEVAGRERRKLYQVAERMYNIYCLMRRRRAPSRRITALINFMAAFYGGRTAVDAARRIAGEPRATADMERRTEDSDPIAGRGSPSVEPKKSPRIDRDGTGPSQAGREHTGPELVQIMNKLNAILRKDLADLERQERRRKSALRRLKESLARLASEEASDETMAEIIHLFMDLAADKNTRESLEQLGTSMSAELPEPLAIGLRMYLGEDVRTAAEIMEVAGDVAERIDERRAELQSMHTARQHKEKEEESQESRTGKGKI